MMPREAFILLINWHIELNVHEPGGYLASNSKIQGAYRLSYC